MRNEKLIARRIVRGLSQKEVAEKSGLPLTNYAYYERGAREPSVTRALRIAKTLAAKVEDLF